MRRWQASSRMWLALAGSLVTGCGGCSDGSLEKNPTPTPMDNGAESVNCSCTVQPTSDGRSAGIQAVSVNIDACLPASNHSDPNGYCQSAVAPWIQSALEQTTLNAQDTGFLSAGTCTAKDLVCGGRCNLQTTSYGAVFQAATCKAAPFPDNALTKANAECEGVCEPVACGNDCVPGGLGQCACTVVEGCRGPTGPVCIAPSVASSSDALSLAPHRTSPMLSFAAYQQQGDWNHDLSTLRVSASVDACVDLLVTSVCKTLTDSATPHVGGTFNLYGRPCPGNSCDISLETDTIVDDFNLDFELAGVDVGHGKLRKLRLSGTTGHVAVDAAGNGVFPAGALVYEAEGRDDQTGDNYRALNAIDQDIHFHIDWQSRLITLSNVTLSFAGGSGVLNLAGTFRASVVEQLENLDSDRDGVPNATDNCPLEPNPDQADHTPPTLTLAPIAPQLACTSEASSIPLPTATDARCSLGGGAPIVSGAIISSNGTYLTLPIPVPSTGQIQLPPGRYVVRWTALDAQGNASTLEQGVDLLPCIGVAKGTSIADRARIEGAGSTPVAFFNFGSEPVSFGVESRAGSVVSRGSVTLWDRARLSGSVNIGGTLTRYNDVSVAGSVAERSNVVLPSFPVIQGAWPTAILAAVSLEPDQQGRLAPGAYSSVSVKSRARLSLEPGVYYFAALDVEPQASVQLAGNTTLEVRDSAILRGSFVTAANVAAPAALRYRSSSPLYLEKGWYGSVLAPNALVVVGGMTGAMVRGQLFAGALEVRPEVVIRAEPLTSGGLLQ